MAINIGVDVGGTFTDFAVSMPTDGTHLYYKVPSTPEKPDRAIIRGLEDLLSSHSIEPSGVLRFSHGTTVGTNALIQRQVGKVAIITTRGFRDLVEIGRQTRPKVYDMHQDFPKPLVPRWLRYEVSERILADGRIHIPLDENEVKELGRILSSEKVDCVAICFLHSHAFPNHEQRAAEVLKSVMGDGISIMTSSMVYPEFREYERFSTTVLNAALLTVMSAYLDRLTEEVKRIGLVADPMISQSGGGLMSATYSRQFPIRSALSGPAAGVIGASYRAVVAGEQNIITLDIGGTSADVSLIANGQPSTVHARHLAGFPLRLPALDVSAVGAGGGSIAWIDRDELLKVGPESAGADPGPACYDRGGSVATVTDANVLLGRLPSEALLDGRMPIRADLAKNAIDSLSAQLNLSLEDTALGIVQVASAVIVKAMRAISVERGHDPSAFTLFAYGGAGPLHAMEVAKELGIKKVFIPPNPGILCAEGLLSSDLIADFVKPILCRFDESVIQNITLVWQDLNNQAVKWFQSEDVSDENRKTTWVADLRYEGQNFELSIPFEFDKFGKSEIEQLRSAFDEAHEVAYGYAQPNEYVELVNIKVKLSGVLAKPSLPKLAVSVDAKPISERKVCFQKGEWMETKVYRRLDLSRGQSLTGPAIIEQMDSIIVVFPGDIARVDDWGNLLVNIS